jgi:hypothetical protein
MVYGVFKRSRTPVLLPREYAQRMFLDAHEPLSAFIFQQNV